MSNKLTLQALKIIIRLLSALVVALVYHEEVPEGTVSDISFDASHWITQVDHELTKEEKPS